MTNELNNQSSVTHLEKISRTFEFYIPSELKHSNLQFITIKSKMKELFSDVTSKPLESGHRLQAASISLEIKKASGGS